MVKKYFSKTIFLPTREGIEREKFSNFNFSNVVWDINTKFSPVVYLNRYPLCTKFEGFWCIGFGFPTKNVYNFKWTWQVHFLSYTLQIWWEFISSLVVKMLKFLKTFCALVLNFPPKMSKTSIGRSGSIFWTTPFKFGENSFLP